MTTQDCVIMFAPLCGFVVLLIVAFSVAELWNRTKAK